MAKRIVITGIGVLASNGTGKEAFWAALREGRSGIKDVSLFDTGKMRTKKAGEIKDFDPVPFLGQKGLRLLDLLILPPPSATNGKVRTRRERYHHIPPLAYVGGHVAL